MIQTFGRFRFLWILIVDDHDYTKNAYSYFYFRINEFSLSKLIFRFILFSRLLEIEYLKPKRVRKKKKK